MSNSSSSTPIISQLDGDVVVAAAEHLVAELIPAMKEQKKVFFLLSGGSNLQVYQELLEQIPADVSLSTLRIGLVDERFVPIDHPDSNETQLKQVRMIDAFRVRGASWRGMLEYGETGLRLAEKASMKYDELFADSDKVIISLGLGEDGHIAGMLPMKSAARFELLFETGNLVSYYDVDPADSENPYHHRLTITPAALQKASKIFVFAVGEKKRLALKKLFSGASAVNELPAALLRKLERPAIVMTDQSIS